MEGKATSPDLGRKARRRDLPLTAALVDLDAIRANVRALKKHVRRALLQIVVKADAYGHGAVATARAASEAGADWLGVYAPSEALALRAESVQLPILAFGPFTLGDARSMVATDVTPTVLSWEAADMLQQAAAGRIVDVHLKVDTGLNRSGLAPSEALALARSMDRFPNLRLQGMYTHFASADEPDNTITRRQTEVLLALDSDLRSRGIQVPLRHAANSAGALSYPESHLDLVRCGIATYGYYPSPEMSQAVQLNRAMDLISTLTRVHAVSAGEGVGYGHEHLCRAASVIGLIPIGYGDGLLRSLGNGRGRVLVHGTPRPIVGRVSMDQITIDLTGLERVRAGDRVTLIGENAGVVQTADDLGAQAGTISYDILTKLLPRVPRLYSGNVSESDS